MRQRDMYMQRTGFNTYPGFGSVYADVSYLWDANKDADHPRPESILYAAYVSGKARTS
jgi:hypothetical protein